VFVMGITRRMRIGMLGCGVFCCLWGPALEAAAGEIFRYRDPEGVLHFSNAPTDDRFSRVGPDERLSGRKGGEETEGRSRESEERDAAQSSHRAAPGIGQATSGDSPRRSAESSPLPGIGRREPTPEEGSVGQSGGQGLARSEVESTVQSAVQPALEPPLRIVRLIEETAARYRIEKALLAAIVRAESGYDPRAVSRAGAAGLMQLMPETAESLGVRDVFHPKQNLEGGALYFRRLLHRFEGDPVLALAAFNAGPTAVERHGGVPPFPETRSYVRRVAAYRQEYLRSREGLPHMVEQRKRPES
jgi:hypothetical protein